MRNMIVLCVFFVMLLILKSGHIIITGNMLIAASVYELVNYFALSYSFQFYLHCLLAITFCVAIYIKRYQLYLLLITTVGFSILKVIYLPKQIASTSTDYTIITGEIAQLSIAVLFYIVVAMFFDRIIKSEIDSGRRLKKLAETDVLTSIYNRKKFDDTIELLTEKKQKFCLAFFDIDHFKRINDTYGHLTGDQVLQSFSNVMQEVFGQADCYRWGGEEFAYIDTVSDRKVFEKKLESFMEILQGKKIYSDIYITTSIGWVCNDISITTEHLLTLVDQALYLAKSNGRNRIEEIRPEVKR